MRTLDSYEYHREPAARVYLEFGDTRIVRPHRYRYDPDDRPVHGMPLFTTMPGKIGERLCATCGSNLVQKPRVKYCSKECAHSTILTDWRCLKGLIYEREKVCQICGFDFDKHERIMKAAGFKWDWDEDGLQIECAMGVRIKLGKPDRNGGHYSAPVLWEVDHIIPKILGGNHWDVNNLRLLCQACHASETAKLAAHRAKKRRKQEVLEI